jgi:23S rRNA pseudouridine2605 synthase
MKRPGFLKRGEKIRLQSFLARSGVASRRAAEEMITHGRIAVNGETVTAMGLQVVPGVDRVEVDGEEVKVAPTTWLALHKPTGYVTSRTDPFGRETVYALLPEKYHGLFHVGRLDRDSEGLLLLTNDGDLANRFLHPSFGITKEYDVIVSGKPTDAVLRQLVEGVELEDGVAKAESAKLVGPAGNGQSRLKLVLREGKKREVRRMLAELGHEVTRLVRRRFGPIDLAELPLGKWRIVAPEELSQVRDPRRGEKPAPRDREDAEPEVAEDVTPRGKTPARAAHNAYGDQPAKRHTKAAGGKEAAGKGESKSDAPRARAVAKDEDYRTRATASTADRKAAGGAARPARSAGKGRPDGKERKAPRSAPLSSRPEDNEWKPPRAAKKPARPPMDADAPPRKRPAAPVRTHAPELDDWADAPRSRAAVDEPALAPRDDRRPASRGKGGPAKRPGGFDRDERPAGPRGKSGPAKRPGGFDREDRAAGPRDKAGPAKRPDGFDREDRAAGPRDKAGPAKRPGGFDREDRAAGPRGKAGPAKRPGGFDREDRVVGPRGKSAPPSRTGGFDRDERAAGPRGKAGPRDRAAGGFDRDERPAAPRGRFGGDDRPPRGRDAGEERRPGGARGGFDREDRPAGPRGRTPDREGRPAAPRGRGEGDGPAPRRFDGEERGAAPRGVRQPPARSRPPADTEEDELDSWSTAPRRKPGGAGGRSAGGRPGGARGGKPGARPSAGKGGGRPGGKGKPGGGKPGGARGPAKPRKPGGGKPRGR